MARGRRIPDAAPAFCAILYTEGDGVQHDRSFNFDAAPLDVGPALDDPGAPPEPPSEGPPGGGGPGGPGEGPARASMAREAVALRLRVAIAGVALAALLWTTRSGAAVALVAGGLWALVAVFALRPDSRPPPWGAP